MRILFLFLVYGRFFYWTWFSLCFSFLDCFFLCSILIFFCKSFCNSFVWCISLHTNGLFTQGSTFLIVLSIVDKRKHCLKTVTWHYGFEALCWNQLFYFTNRKTFSEWDFSWIPESLNSWIVQGSLGLFEEEENFLCYH